MIARALTIAAAVASLAGPASAQEATDGVDPRAATAIVTMTGVAAEYCRQGSERACEINERIQVAATRLIAAQEACANGSAAACTVVERGVAEVSVAYEEFRRGIGALRPQPGAAPDR